MRTRGEVSQRGGRRGRGLTLTLLVLCAAALVACDDGGGGDETLTDTLAPSDAGGDDAGDDVDGDGGDADGGDADGGDVDGGDAGCQRVAVTTWELERADDVSIGYQSLLEPRVDGAAGSSLTLLFERYAPQPDIGTFVLGEGSEANFGTCARCLFVGTSDPTRAYFADRGELTSRTDPYGRQLDATVTGLRLIEVTVDLETRSSTPVADGACVVVEDFTVTGSFPPPEWTCAAADYNDGQGCHCECGADDPDCFTHSDCPPFDPSCPPPADPLPVVDCAAEEVCALDPATFTTRCTEACDWAGRGSCGEGTCVYEFGTGDGDVCVVDGDRLDAAVVGAPCADSFLQTFCALEDGFAMGYCGPAGICRAVCASDAECAGVDEACRFFVGDEGLGYCGPPPPTDG